MKLRARPEEIRLGRLANRIPRLGDLLRLLPERVLLGDELEQASRPKEVHVGASQLGFDGQPRAQQNRARQARLDICDLAPEGLIGYRIWVWAIRPSPSSGTVPSTAPCASQRRRIERVAGIA